MRVIIIAITQRSPFRLQTFAFGREKRALPRSAHFFFPSLPLFSLCECCSFRFSAGAGRTGTFIALSNILERVKAEGLLDVFQTVKSLRTQRPHMVQTVVGGQRDNVRSAARKLTAFSHLCCLEVFSAHKWRSLAVTPLLLFPPPGAIRLLLQGGSGFR